MVNKIKRLYCKIWNFTKLHYYKIASWLYYNSPIYIMWPAIWKCWREWWKVRKYFLHPNIKSSWNKNKWFYSSNASIFSFEIHPLNWKVKYADNVYEGVPYILFQFFNKYQFVIEFVAPESYETSFVRNDIYYESILDKAYGVWSYADKKQIKMTIKEVFEHNKWRSYKEHSNEYELLTCMPYLKKKSIEKIIGYTI